MSLTSLLLAFAPAIAARFEKPKRELTEVHDPELMAYVRVLELGSENKRLKGELEGVKADLKYLHGACERMAARLRHNDLLLMPAGGQQQHPPAQYAQNALAHQLQQQQAMAQNMQAYQGMQNLAGLQQAQPGLVWPEDWHCDCSPTRSRALGLVPGA